MYSPMTAAVPLIQRRLCPLSIERRYSMPVVRPRLYVSGSVRAVVAVRSVCVRVSSLCVSCDASTAILNSDAPENHEILCTRYAL